MTIDDRKNIQSVNSAGSVLRNIQRNINVAFGMFNLAKILYEHYI